MSDFFDHTDDLEIGPGVYLRYYSAGSAERCGAIFIHPDQKTGSGECWGSIHFSNHPDSFILWDFNFDYEKPTLTPSILCRECGFHGWIKDGKWMSA